MAFDEMKEPTWLGGNEGWSLLARALPLGWALGLHPPHPGLITCIAFE
jgi:hypothetical protein